MVTVISWFAVSNYSNLIPRATLTKTTVAKYHCLIVTVKLKQCLECKDIRRGQIMVLARKYFTKKQLCILYR